MAKLIWTEPALKDLDDIAAYIAHDNPAAARRLVERVFQHVEQLGDHPDSGSIPKEFRNSRYRQIVEPPCRGPRSSEALFPPAAQVTNVSVSPYRQQAV